MQQIIEVTARDIVCGDTWVAEFKNRDGEWEPHPNFSHDIEVRTIKIFDGKYMTANHELSRSDNGEWFWIHLDAAVRVRRSA